MGDHAEVERVENVTPEYERPRPLKHPPFSAERICAKCGGDDIGADYRNDGCSDRSCTTCPVECIVRTCRRCHFMWAEKPLDTSTVDDHEKASGVGT